MPSKSKSQQRLFGWVHACQKGTAKNCPDNVSKIAGSISYKDAEDFARTKHKGLPEKKKPKTFKEYIQERDHMKNFEKYRENEQQKENLDFGGMHQNLGRTATNVRTADRAFDKRVGGNYGSKRQQVAYLVGEIEAVLSDDPADAKNDQDILIRLKRVINKLQSGINRMGRMEPNPAVN